jgi:hypothetical protein
MITRSDTTLKNLGIINSDMTSDYDSIEEKVASGRFELVWNSI